MEQPFTDEEIIQMAESQRPTALWQRAFTFHNSDRNNKRLGLGCPPCYSKVLAYILKARFLK